MNRFLALLGCLLAIATGCEARPSWMNRTGASSVFITPGSLTPSTWTTTCSNGGAGGANICPTTQGSSGDYGYTEPTMAVWADIPEVDNDTGADIIRCVHAGHLMTSATVATGSVTGIDHVTFFVNGYDHALTVSTVSTCPEDNEPGYLVKLHPTSLSYSGQIEWRAWVVPVTGPPALLESPDTPLHPCADFCVLDENVDNGNGLLHWAGYRLHVNPSTGSDIAGCGTTAGTACATVCYTIGRLHTNKGANDISSSYVLQANATYLGGTSALDCTASYDDLTGYTTFMPDPDVGATQSGVVWAWENAWATQGPHVGRPRYYNMTIDMSQPTQANGGTVWDNDGIESTYESPGSSVKNATPLCDGSVYIGPGMHYSQANGFLGAMFRNGLYAVIRIRGCDMSNMGDAADGYYTLQNTTIHKIGQHVMYDDHYELNVTGWDASDWYHGRYTFASGSTTLTTLNADDLQKDDSLIDATTGCLNAKVTAVNYLTSPITVTVDTASTCAVTNGILTTEAHPDFDKTELATTAPHVWMGVYSDGTSTTDGTVSGHGVSFINGPAGGGGVTQNFYLYDVNSYIDSLESNNWGWEGAAVNVENWLIVNSNWGGGVGNYSGAPTVNDQAINVHCYRGATIGNGFTGLTFNDTGSPSNLCH